MWWLIGIIVTAIICIGIAAMKLREKKDNDETELLNKLLAEYRIRKVNECEVIDAEVVNG